MMGKRRTLRMLVGGAVLLAGGLFLWRGDETGSRVPLDPKVGLDAVGAGVGEASAPEAETVDVRNALPVGEEASVKPEASASLQPRVRGRVVKDGVGVPGAEVFLERDLRGMEGLDLEWRSPHPFKARIGPGVLADEEGRFEVEGLAREGWFLRARGPSGASGRAKPPVSVFEGQDAEVVIELDELPGRVLGELVVPPGERPDDYILKVSGADDWFLMRLAPSGQFLWDPHPAGRWNAVVYRMHDIIDYAEPGQRFEPINGDGWHTAGGPPEWALSDVRAFPFTVSPGQTTDLVIDPRKADFQRMVGELQVRRGDEEPGPWVASVFVLPADDRSDRRFGNTRMKPDGTFELLTRAEGELIVKANFKFTPDWTGTWKGFVCVLDRVDLKPGTNAWDFRLDLGRLRVFLPEGVARTQVELLHRHASGARIYASAILVEDGEPGEIFFPNAPVGLCELFEESAGVRRVLATYEVLQNPGVDEMKLDLRRGTAQK